MNWAFVSIGVGLALALPRWAAAQEETCHVSPAEAALLARPELQARLHPQGVWAPPPYKIKAQALSERILAAHPELQAVNLHGHVPGVGVATEFAGTLCFRIGHKEGADDLMIIDEGMTLIDPRMGKDDPDGPKYEVLLPLHDAAGEHRGMVVLIFRKNAYGGHDIQRDLYSAAIRIRDEMAAQIPGYDALFERAGG